MIVKKMTFIYLAPSNLITFTIQYKTLNVINYNLVIQYVVSVLTQFIYDTTLPQIEDSVIS